MTRKEQILLEIKMLKEELAAIEPQCCNTVKVEEEYEYGITYSRLQSGIGFVYAKTAEEAESKAQQLPESDITWTDPDSDSILIDDIYATGRVKRETVEIMEYI